MLLKNKILITGTTNGIGKALTEYYIKLGYKVIGIDRNLNTDLTENSNYHQIITDITNTKKVDEIINKFISKNDMPQYFILNAGVNIYDNTEFFNVNEFKRCFDINFYGSFNFISSLEKYKLKKIKILVISSTSKIIPNPATLGYFSSKYLLHKLTTYLSSEIDYKVAILGPIKTDISRNLQKPSGLALVIYKLLIVDTNKLPLKIDKFLKSNKKRLYFTKKSLFIYNIIKLILIFFPSLYKGGKSK